MSRYIASGVVLAALLGLVPAAPAAFIVRVESATVAAEGSTTLDVFISSDSGTTELNQFAYMFEVVRTSGTQGRLEFGALPAGLSGLGNYVFSGQGSPYGFAATTIFPNDTFLGGDDIYPDNVTVTTSEVLLTRLVLNSSLLAPTAEGTTFEVRLVPGGGLGELGDDTYFAYTGVTGADIPVAYQSIAGLVTINSAGVIPEPSTLLLASTAGLILLAHPRARRLLARRA